MLSSSPKISAKTLSSVPLVLVIEAREDGSARSDFLNQLHGLALELDVQQVFRIGLVWIDAVACSSLEPERSTVTIGTVE